MRARRRCTAAGPLPSHCWSTLWNPCSDRSRLRTRATCAPAWDPLEQAAHLFTHTPFPRLLAAVIDLAERDPSLTAAHAGLTARQRAPLLQILIRAQARGQVADRTDPEVLVDLLVGSLFYRRFVAHTAIGPDLIDAVIDRTIGPAA